MKQVGQVVLSDVVSYVWQINNFEKCLKDNPGGICSSGFYERNNYYLNLWKRVAERNSVYIKLEYFHSCTVFCNIQLLPANTSARNQINYSYTSKALHESSTDQGLCIDEQVLLQSRNVFFPNGTLKIVCTLSAKLEILETLFQRAHRNLCETAAQTELSPTATQSAFKELASAEFQGTANLSEHLQQLYRSGQFSDVTIKVQDKDFKVHKSILAARSPVFASMFENEMSEKSTGIVKINDCDASTFEELLFFMYSGKLNHVTSENSISLYRMGDQYDLKELKDDCTRRLVNDMSVDIFFHVIRFAALYNDTELLEASTDCFIKNTKQILSSSNWMSFIKECPELVTDLNMKLINNIRI